MVISHNWRYNLYPFISKHQMKKGIIIYQDMTDKGYNQFFDVWPIKVITWFDIITITGQNPSSQWTFYDLRMDFLWPFNGFLITQNGFSMTLYILIIKERNKRNSDKAFSGCCIIMRCTFYNQWLLLFAE